MNVIHESLRQIQQILQAGDATANADAHALLARVLDEQVQDESSPACGQFPKIFGGGTGDYNMALFMLPTLIDLSAQQGATLPPALNERLDRALRLALTAAERRWNEEIFDLQRDCKSYTNIFLLYIQALLLGGRHLADARLTRTGVAQWKRWLSHIAYTGIDEFVSDYFTVDCVALQRIRELAPDPAMRRQVTRVLDHLAVIKHATTHPRLKLAVCGCSRDYRRFLVGGPQEGRCIEAGAADPAAAATPGVYRPPHKVVDAYRNRRFPYRVAGRATSQPFRYRSWQNERSALGSMTGGNVFWQQIHCMAAAGDGADEREVVFMPGAYTIANGYVSQHDNRALCLFSRRPNTYLRTQKFASDTDLRDAFGDYGIGLTAGWAVTVEDHRLILTAYGQRVTIDPFSVDDTTVQPVALTPVRRDSLSQGRFHRTEADMTEYLFPGQVEWFGCLVEMNPLDIPEPAPPAIVCHREASRLRLDEGGRLQLNLHLNPAGGDIELYETDWRTLPLLDCPEQTLQPGDLLLPEQSEIG